MSRPYTLIIGGWSSTCGHCGLSADPLEKTHEHQLGFKHHGEPGCGVRWVLMTSEYSGVEERLREMRPDLELA